MSLLDKILKFLRLRPVQTILDEETLAALTAYHEAAHAVLTHISRYHKLIGRIQLHARDIGETYVSLNRAKLARAGKPTDNTVFLDLDYVEDASKIYLAGYAAEKHFCRVVLQEHSGIPSRDYSQNDYNTVGQIMRRAQISERRISEYEIGAANLVNQNWEPIELLAPGLLRTDGRTIDAIEAIDYLDRHYNTYSWP